MTADPGPGDDRSWRYDTVTDAFLALEADLELFERRIDGVPFWERVRFNVHKRVLEATGVRGDDSPGSDRSTAGRVRDLADSVLVRNPYLAGDVDVAVFGHPRRKRLEDGRWWDVHCDPVIERLDSAAVSFEIPYGHGHSRPARTDRLRYLDVLETAAALHRRVGTYDPLTDGDRTLLARVRASIRDRFGVEVDVAGRVESMLQGRRVRLRKYERLLERLDPDLAVVRVSYGASKETQLEACHRLDVPTAELQHGVIDRYNLGYAYPGRRRKETFPNHLLVYGEFWRDAVEYPIPAERVHPVGYPFLESRYRRYADRESTARLVVVSQGAIGAALSRFAVELAGRDGFPLDVVYKLHPAEATAWRTAYPWLADAAADGALEVVDDTDASLYGLFAASTAQLGVYSTAVYEGLCFDLRTYVADLPGAVRLRPLLEDGSATLVGSVDDLVAAERSATGTPSFDRERYFASGALEAVPERLEALARAP